MATETTTIDTGEIKYQLEVADEGCDLYVSAVGPHGLEVRRVFGMKGKDPFGTPYEPPKATR